MSLLSKAELFVQEAPMGNEAAAFIVQVGAIWDNRNLLPFDDSTFRLTLPW